MFSVELEDNISVKLEGLVPSVIASLKRAVAAEAVTLQQHIIRDKLEGQVLRHGKGRLAQSIQEDAPLVDGETVYARVFSSGDVKYARIHEYGGVINHPGGTAYIFDRKAQAVRFISNAAAAAMGGDLPRTKPHQIPIPQRSFMRSALADRKQAIIEAIQKAARDGAQEVKA